MTPRPCGNRQLVADADAAVVVWDGECRRDADLATRCRRKGIPLKVIMPAAEPGEPGPDPEPPPRYTRLPD